MNKFFLAMMEFIQVQWEDLKLDEEIYYTIVGHGLYADSLHGPFIYRGDGVLENLQQVRLKAGAWKITLWRMKK